MNSFFKKTLAAAAVSIFSVFPALNMTTFALFSTGTVAMTAIFVTHAEAGDTLYVTCDGVPQDACDTMIAALKRAPYIGPIRPASEPMACARVVSYGPAPVVWVNGTSRNYKTAPVITDTGVVYTERFGLNQNWTVTESCIPRRLLNSVSNLTLCTGLGEDGYHWSLTSKELGLMKRTGHFTSYVPFLEVRDRDSLSISQVTSLYSNRYGAHY